MPHGNQAVTYGALRTAGGEHHWWPSCPCGECKRERDKRARAERAPARNPVISLHVEAAHLLGLIPRRSPHGSVARELAAT